MKLATAILSLLATACSYSHPAEKLIHVPITVGGITYQWPSGGSADSGDPAISNSHAYIPKRIWNEVIGVIPSMRYFSDEGEVSVFLEETKESSWNIHSDGSGLPAQVGKFVKTEAHPDYVMGESRGPGIISPPTIVIFKSEPNAYLSCMPGVGNDPLKGICLLFLNDRGVVHQLALSWGVWENVPAMLKLYRALIGIHDGI